MYRYEITYKRTEYENLTVFARDRYAAFEQARDWMPDAMADQGWELDYVAGPFKAGN